MCKAVPMALFLSSSVLSLWLLHLCSAAPGQPTAHSEEGHVAAVVYPFQSKEESQRLLRTFIDSILNKEDHGRPEINSWEQEVFFVFRLHDYDHSGFLDGLEMLKLLHDFNAFHTPGVVPSNNEVVPVVDFLLLTQDLNHDGLFSPSELLSPPLLTQNEEMVKDPIEVPQNEVEVQMETQPQQEGMVEPLVSAHEQDVPQEAPVPPAPGQAEVQEPVHQGQPEM